MRRRRKFLLFLLPLLAALLAVDLIYLNHIIERRANRGLIEIPSYIFGKPVELAGGDNLFDRFLFNYLDILGFSERAGTLEPGEFSRDGGLIRIKLKDFTDQEILHKGFMAEVKFNEKTGDITDVVAGGVPVDTLVIGVPEIGRVADTRREIRQFIPVDEMSPYLVQATLAAEDRRFFNHHGIDYRALVRALIKDISTMSMKEGGSTITQQLARNFFLTAEKTITRKFQETLIALLLEMKYSKERILEFYLNQVYLGQRGSEGIYGVGEASSFYFGKSAKKLDLAESMVIASLIKSPHYYSPVRHPERTLWRMEYILKGMKGMGFLRPGWGSGTALELPPILSSGAEKSSTGYFTDTVMELLTEKLEDNDVFYGGYRIFTTLEPVLQKIAYNSLRESLTELEKRYNLEKALQGAVVVIDNRDGGISALVGGRDYGTSQFNRATKARRQVGSLFKPFVALAAIRGAEGKEAVTLSSTVDASGVTVKTESGDWLPRNFNDREYGTVTVRRILEESINTGAISLGLEAGLENIIKTCSSLGLGQELKPYPSMILGSFTYTPVQMAYAYASFPSGGIKYPFRIVKSVMKKGKGVLQNPAFPLKVLKPEEAFLISYALNGAVRNGTGSSLGSSIKGYISGKTGTTDDGRDSWFVALTGEYTVIAWVGYDDSSPTPLTGATGALPVCKRILHKIYSRKPPFEPPVPGGIIFRKVDAETGLLATSGCKNIIDEAFIEGTEPIDYCRVHPAGAGEELGNMFLEILRDAFRGLKGSRQ